MRTDVYTRMRPGSPSTAAPSRVRIALTRDVSPSITRCELVYLDRVPIDVRRARVQHARYEEALAAAGCLIRRLSPLPDLPDAVFIEDTAIVLDELAIIARPGAVSRRLETSAVANALEAYRPLAFIDPPGTLDGGDIVRVGRILFAGMSSRTNADGVAALIRIVAPFGYKVRTVVVSSCLHLKSAVSALDDHTLLVDPSLIPPDAFEGFDRIAIDPAERGAANALVIGDTVLIDARFQRTARILTDRGYEVLTVDMSELAKAEGAVSCCSLIVDTNG